MARHGAVRNSAKTAAVNQPPARVGMATGGVVMVTGRARGVAMRETESGRGVVVLVDTRETESGRGFIFKVTAR